MFTNRLLRSVVHRRLASAALAGAGAAVAVWSTSDCEGSVTTPLTNTTNSSRFNFIADAAEVAAPAVVNILVDVHGPLGMSGLATGSGFIVDSSKGLVATNAHVVAHAAATKGRVFVTLHDNRRLSGKVHSLDRQLDIALVEIDRKELPSWGQEPLPEARIGTSSELRAGEWVVALGSPLHLQNTVTAGIVSSIARGASEIGMGEQNYEYLQTDAAINQGNSGGPLVNIQGEVVGINTAKLGGQHVSGISFAIPIDTAWQVIQQLMQHRNVRRPYLGIKFVSEAHPASSQPRVPGEVHQKVTVLEVAPGSPAATAGLLPGDEVVAFGGRPVRRVRDVVERLGYEPGRELKMQVKRKGAGLVDVILIASESLSRTKAPPVR